MTVSVERLDDALDHLLGIGQQHHGVVLVEQRIVDAGIAGSQRAFDEQTGASLVDIQNWHAVDR